MSGKCAFCAIIDGSAPATIVDRDAATITIVPLNPVTPGHLLVIPVLHVQDFTTDPNVSAIATRRAAEIAATMCDCNLITSKGCAATQSVFHLHFHLVPRDEHDGLALPWSAAGHEAGRPTPQAGVPKVADKRTYKPIKDGKKIIPSCGCGWKHNNSIESSRNAEGVWSMHTCKK